MTRTWKRVTIALAIGLGLVGARFFERFPWASTLHALSTADMSLLLLAALVNFLATLAKGWGWHLLLRPGSPHRWRLAEEATLVGAAVNCLVVSVGGEAARVQYIVSRSTVTPARAVTAILASRAVEALGLVVFTAIACVWAPPASWPLSVRVVLATVAVVVVLGASFGAWQSMLRRAPSWAQPFVKPLALWGPRTIAIPLGLAVAAWTAEWGTFHLVIVATHNTVPAAVSLTALLAANVGGIFRITPGNVGVLQASLLVAMLPFGIPATEAIAAGLALQAVQTLPTVAMGGAIVGLRSLRRLVVRPPKLATDS